MLIVCHAKEVFFLRRLLRFMPNVDVLYEYRGPDLCCFEKPIDVIYIVKGADACCRE